MKTAAPNLERIRAYTRDILSPLLESFFRSLRGRFEAVGPEGEKYWHRLVMLSGRGKLSRPFLYFLALSALTGRLPRKKSAVAELGLLVEITHFTSLLIDDFIDQDGIRRHAPTYHEYLEAVGIDLLHQSGVISGTCFILLGALRNFLLNLDIPHGKKQALMELHNMHEQLVSSGFMKELEMSRLLSAGRYASGNLSLENFHAMTELKTGILIREPLLNACIMAGFFQDSAEYRGLKSFGTHLGIAYQIRDDIMDLFDPEGKQRPAGSDIRGHKPSILTILALLEDRRRDRADFSALLEEHRRSPKSLKEFQDYFRNSGILDQAVEEYRKGIEAAGMELEALKRQSGNPVFAEGGWSCLNRFVETMKDFEAACRRFRAERS